MRRRLIDGLLPGEIAKRWQSECLCAREKTSRAASHFRACYRFAACFLFSTMSSSFYLLDDTCISQFTARVVIRRFAQIYADKKGEGASPPLSIAIDVNYGVVTMASSM
jgi:hypothetical protein